MHIGGVLVFEPRPDRSPPSFDELCEQLDARVSRLPHFLDRLAEPETGGITWPEWVPDERFNLRGHLQHVTMPSPGGNEELRQWAGEFYSQRLDRSRPLWEMAMIDGLAGARWAIATRRLTRLLHRDKAAEGLRRARAAARMIIEDEVVAAPRSSLTLRPPAGRGRRPRGALPGAAR